MSVIQTKSISGITSITTPSGADNLLTIHTSDTTERFRVDNLGNTKVGSGVTLSPDGDVFFTGIITGNGSGLSNVGVDTAVVFTDKLGLGDNEYINVGLGSDLKISHNGSTSKINNATGRLDIECNQISLWNQAGSEALADFNADGACELYHNNALKLATASNGVSVTGKLATDGDIDSGTGYYQITSGTTRFSLTHDGANCYLENQIGSFYVKTADNTNTLEISNDTVAIPNDNDKLKIGAGGDLEIFHDGSNTRIYNNTGSLFFRASDFYFQDTTGDENLAKFIDNGACELYHDNVKKFETASTGVIVTGGSNARSLKVNNTHTNGGEIACFDNAANNHYGSLVISGGEIDRECRLEAAYNNSLMTFWTMDSSSAAERMRITEQGYVLFNKTTHSITTVGTSIMNNGELWVTAATASALSLNRQDNDGQTVRFHRGGSHCGNISVTSSSTAYNTSSDYRLKENQVAISDGITRLKQLKPYRFNFKIDPDKTVDGFFAHEVTPVVAEAIFGEKDAVETADNDVKEIKKGDPIYQQIDQAKLVPLLTAALQEAIAKIETLETKVATLESS